MRMVGVDRLRPSDAETVYRYFRPPPGMLEAATQDETVGVSTGLRVVLLGSSRWADGEWRVEGYPFLVDAEERMKLQPQAYFYLILDGDSPWPSES